MLALTRKRHMGSDPKLDVYGDGPLWPSACLYATQAEQIPSFSAGSSLALCLEALWCDQLPGNSNIHCQIRITNLLKLNS